MKARPSLLFLAFGFFYLLLSLLILDGVYLKLIIFLIYYLILSSYMQNLKPWPEPKLQSIGQGTEGLKILVLAWPETYIFRDTPPYPTHFTPVTLVHHHVPSSSLDELSQSQNPPTNPQLMVTSQKLKLPTNTQLTLNLLLLAHPHDNMAFSCFLVQFALSVVLIFRCMIYVFLN